MFIYLLVLPSCPAHQDCMYLKIIFFFSFFECSYREGYIILLSLGTEPYHSISIWYDFNLCLLMMQPFPSVYQLE
ncbi:unnamed protein product, partial [Allacma fusca]